MAAICFIQLEEGLHCKMTSIKNIKKHTLVGTLWMGVGTGGQQVLSFAIMLVLARQLGPASFGLVGIASVLVEILTIIGRAGLTSVIVQAHDPSQRDLSTAFWTSLLFGSLLSLAMYFSSAGMAALFEEPGLEPVINYLSVVCFLNTLGTVHEAIIRKSFGFRALAMRDVAATLVSGAAAIYCVFSGYGVMSLVVQRLVSTLWVVVALWAVVKWRPSLTFSVTSSIRQLRSGVAISGASLLGTGNQRIIDLIVGYFLGSSALGYLRIAWRGLDMLLSLSITPVSNVISSSLSYLQSDKAALARAYGRIVQLTSLFIFPLFLGGAVVAPELIVFAFGEKWKVSASLMQILTLQGIFVPFTYYRTNILIAAGQAKQVFYISSISFGISVVVALAAAQIGLEATAWGNVLRVALITPISMWHIQKYAQTSAVRTLKKAMPSAGASIIMVICLLVVRGFLRPHLTDFQMLVFMISLGGIVYMGTLWLLFGSFCRDTVSFLFGAGKPRKVCVDDEANKTLDDMGSGIRRTEDN